MLNSYVLLDLETTGATPLNDRITEIALIRFENGQEVDRWQTLVNPQTSIRDGRRCPYFRTSRWRAFRLFR
jgi:DNA polymerase-3 subunit epsilon